MFLLKRTRHSGSDIAVILVLLYLFHDYVDSKSIVTTIATLTDTSKNTVKPSDNLNSVTTDSELRNNSSSTTVSPSASVKSVVEVEVNSTQTNSTKSNYMIEYKTLVFDSPDDIKTQQEWGGNCTLTNWNECKVLARWFGKYEDPKDGEIKEYFIDCKEEPVVCLTNSWTVTRCNLLCMGRCNVRFKKNTIVYFHTSIFLLEIKKSSWLLIIKIRLRL